ncbi:MAG: purine-nucleoside phosphorylase [Flavobacteriales bacterium]
MSDTLKNINEAVSFIQKKGVKQIEAGIILGTGLHGLSKEMEVEIEIDYKEIPHFPVSTVEFHSGKLLYGKLAGKKVLAFNGRFHSYEGYTMKQVAMPVWVLKKLGAPYLLVSNAAGGINLEWKKGDLMLVHDHINLLPSNPLIGRNIDELGPRFPDMSKAYHTGMNTMLESIAKKQSVMLRKGIYVAVTGPNLETAAEYRFLHRIGADAVGMSTVPEVIAANHCALPVAAVSVLTDECDPDNLKPIDIPEIIRIAGEAEPKLTELYKQFITEFVL